MAYSTSNETAQLIFNQQIFSNIATSLMKDFSALHLIETEHLSRRTIQVTMYTH